MRACIFDLDGTLTDTLESLTYSVNLTLEEMGFPKITPDQCRSFVGNGAKVLIEKALKASGDEGASRLNEGMEVYRRIFGQNCTYHVAPYDGICHMLEDLKRQNVMLGVLSNKPHGQTVDVVKTIFGEDVFTCVQGQCDEIPRKPDPAGVYLLMEQMGVSKEECLYVGDSEVDIFTGKAAGVRCVGVSWGFRSRELLKDAGAEYVIDRPEELLQFIL
ncbi:HAD family hydrolase [Sporofaciens sp. SGI.106]|uniref:HAD family hydrolase n=1 Tax=Sporofaciens sp. SGI.106 TaxID=3420568 RepID=UPI002A949BC6|nr:HAD family hydrolase [Lachnoclostridium sp.]